MWPSTRAPRPDGQRRWRRPAERFCASIPTARRHGINRAGTPVFAADFQSPRGLDWHPGTGALWAADVKGKAVEELRVIVSGGTVGSTSRARIALPAGTGTAGVAFYRGTLLPALTGDLLVAAEDGRHLLRLRFDERDPLRVVSSERLLQDAAGPIRTVAVAPDGVVYVATDHAMLRLGPR